MQRRQLLQALAFASLPAGAAFAQDRDAAGARDDPAPLRLATAWRGAREDSPHHVGVWDVDWASGRIGNAWQWRAPSRPHGLALEDDGSLLAVAMRPAGWLVRLDAEGRPRQSVELDRESRARSFNGHVLCSADGQRLYTTETDTATGAGVVGVRDRRTLHKLDEWRTEGVDAHELVEDAQGALIVANGGILRWPDGRKRDLDRMDPSLVRIDARSGALLGQWRLPDPRLSVRHLAWGADAGSDSPLLGIALQAEHDDKARRTVAPLLALFDGRELKLAAPGADGGGYAGDIAPAGRDGFALSAQREHLALRWDARESAAFTAMARLQDVCGLAALPGDALGATVLTAARGVGLWRAGRAAAFAAWPQAMAVDNHCVVLAAR